MEKKTLWIIGGIVAVLIGGVGWLAIQAPTEEKVAVDENRIILFYGDGCPHCEDVDEYITQNDIKNKVDFVELEVWNNTDNSAIMKELAQKCGLDTNKIGVPFLVADGGCYMGGPDVQDIFKQKAGL
ncbi:MAG: hypothetical protein U9Q12_02225 [Patescibacteria group bacterium]|nr:hypothetical protein [Patescibacteria group bacterium]